MESKTADRLAEVALPPIVTEPPDAGPISPVLHLATKQHRRFVLIITKLETWNRL
jgi:hypothetical protein